MQRFRFFLSVGLVASTGLIAAIACDPPATKKPPLKTSPDKPDDDDDNADDDDDNGPLRPVDAGESDLPLPDGGKPPGRIFAHTATALYFFEPLSRELTKVGDFVGLDDGDEVIDLAVDRDNVVFGTTFGGFVRISPTDAKVDYIKRGFQKYPNALAFMPMGTVDPTKEALVGYGPPIEGQAMEWLRIDTSTGDIADIGNLNPDNAAVQFVSAGDIISMERNGKAYAAIKKAVPSDSGVVENDQLVEIDPTTGTIKTVVGDLGAKLTYGLAQWAGTAYAFNANGDIIELDLTPGGKGKVIKSLADAGVDQGWYGAGVTTAAPSKP